MGVMNLVVTVAVAVVVLSAKLKMQLIWRDEK